MGQGEGLPEGSSTQSQRRCNSTLARICVPGKKMTGPGYDTLAFHKFSPGRVIDGHGNATSNTDSTAAFLLTRGPWALLGYTWGGCQSGQTTGQVRLL